MADKPMIFSAPMVRALLDGRKTQTRRVLKPQPDSDFLGATIAADSLTFRPAALFGTDTHKTLRRIPRRRDRLWVRETWLGYSEKVKGSRDECRWCFYRATDEDQFLPGMKWRSPIHMHRRDSRLTLIVTDVRVLRVQDIEPDDAYEEGVKCDMSARTVIEHYRNLWDSLNAKRGYPWESNPWVCALTFDVTRQNIDALSTGGAAGM